MVVAYPDSCAFDRLEEALVRWVLLQPVHNQPRFPTYTAAGQVIQRKNAALFPSALVNNRLVAALM